MAIQQQHALQKYAEDVIGNPPQATFLVGSSILILLQTVQFLQDYWIPLRYLTYLIPFIPSFFITRIAKQINQRRAEHDFIKDAEPYIFVAFPDKCTEEALLNVRPAMISDRSADHLNCSISNLLQQEALPGEYISYNQRIKIIRRLIHQYDMKTGEGSITHIKVYIHPRGQKQPRLFLMSSKLEKYGNKLKWQATLMDHNPLKT